MMVLVGQGEPQSKKKKKLSWRVTLAFEKIGPPSLILPTLTERLILGALLICF